MCVGTHLCPQRGETQTLPLLFCFFSLAPGRRSWVQLRDRLDYPVIPFCTCRAPSTATPQHFCLGVKKVTAPQCAILVPRTKLSLGFLFCVLFGVCLVGFFCLFIMSIRLIGLFKERMGLAKKYVFSRNKSMWINSCWWSVWMLQTMAYMVQELIPTPHTCVWEQAWGLHRAHCRTASGKADPIPHLCHHPLFTSSLLGEDPWCRGQPSPRARNQLRAATGVLGRDRRW